MTILSKFSRKIGSRGRHVFIPVLSVVIVPTHPRLCAHSQGCDHTRLVPRTSGGNETLTITSHLVAAKGDSGVRVCRDLVSRGKG